MNKYSMMSLLMFSVISTQAAYQQMPRVAQGRGMQRGRVVGTVPMQQQQRMQAGKTVLQGIAARTREDEAKALEYCKNNQEQFLCKFVMFLNKLAAETGKVAIKCQAVRVEGSKVVANYVNPNYVGRSAQMQTVAGGESSKCNAWAKPADIAEVSAKIHSFVKANAGRYQQQCQLVGNVPPQNVLLTYTNPTNLNTNCYVFSDINTETTTYMGAPTIMQEPTKGTNFVGPMKK